MNYLRHNAFHMSHGFLNDKMGKLKINPPFKKCSILLNIFVNFKTESPAFNKCKIPLGLKTRPALFGICAYIYLLILCCKKNNLTPGPAELFQLYFSLFEA